MILSEGDKLLIFAPDDLLNSSEKRDYTAAAKDIDVVFEDENVLIAYKPSGLLVHSDESGDASDTLIDRIIGYLISKREYDPETENSFAPALCNRIDRNTEGLVIAAKNASALREMNAIIKNRDIKKVYLAAVHGVIAPPDGEISLLLEKDPQSNTVHVKTKRTSPAVKSALTQYRTVSVSADKKFSLVEVVLITGRTHQIRVSFAHIGHPLLGDGKYAVNKADRAIGYDSQALCAYRITFGDLSDYALLSYLSGKTFESRKPDFLKLFDQESFNI